MDKIEILDTTLRDGAQGEGISFSVGDKLSVVRTLDELGVSWIEAGNPGSNPKDMEFFRSAHRLNLENAKLCAFGATRKKGKTCDKDSGLQSLLSAETEGVVVFGKSWDLHVKDVLKASPEENLDMIRESVSYLKGKGRFVIYDAEHFFDGWKANPKYAIASLESAMEAGADRIVLCDTNGGSFPDIITDAVWEAANSLGREKGKNDPGIILGTVLGIHAHNDIDMASANTIAAVMTGCRHVQGTLAGFGERCGNASLAVLLPSLELKLGFSCLPPGNLAGISEKTRKIAEIANVIVPENMPYIGRQAFTHKGGMHTDGIIKSKKSFEHIDPSLVGNYRHLLVSEMGGRSVITEKVKKIVPKITRDDPVILSLTEKLKNLEAMGWQFEGAEASFELFVRRELGLYKPFFNIEAYRVVSEHPAAENISCSHAWVKVLVKDREEIAAAEGDGPVHALDTALRRGLMFFYPELENVRLSDYKVRVIDGTAATAAKVRVLISSTDGKNEWTTLGVSEDIIDASRAALVDSIEYRLNLDGEQDS